MLNRNGFSLVGVLIGVAITGVVSLAFVSMLTAQNRAIKSLQERLAITNLETVLAVALADGSVCRHILNTPSPLTFNANRVSRANPQVISLPANRPVYASVSPTGVLGPVVARVGLTPSAYANNVVINSIQLSIEEPPSPMPPPGPGATFRGNWSIGFDRNRLTAALKPAQIPVILTADTSAPGTARITGCMGANTPPPAETTIDVYMNPACGGYCSCHVGWQPWVPDSNAPLAICRSRGFSTLVRYTTTGGPVDRTICGANGTGCFQNKNPGNIVCTTVTCR